MDNDDAGLESLRSEAIGYYNQDDFDKAVTIHKNIIIEIILGRRVIVTEDSLSIY